MGVYSHRNESDHSATADGLIPCFAGTRAHPYGGGHDAGSEASSIHSHRYNLLLAYSTVGLIPCFAGTGAKEAGDEEVDGRSPRFPRDDGFNTNRHAKEARDDEFKAGRHAKEARDDGFNTDRHVAEARDDRLNRHSEKPFRATRQSAILKRTGLRGVNQLQR